MIDPVAIYAAVLSTVLGLWAVYDRLRPRVNVTGSAGRLGQNLRLGPARGRLFSGGRFTDDDSIGEEVLTVQVVNVGARPLAVKEVGLAVRNDGRRQNFMFTGRMDELPKALATGEWFMGWARASALDERGPRADVLHPYCLDMEGRTHRGRFDEHFREWRG